MFWPIADKSRTAGVLAGDGPPAGPASRLPRSSSMAGGIFSLGGVLARWWKPAYPLLPWAFTSAMLTCAGMWDYWSRGGPIDYLVLGLAAYELMLGLLEERAVAPASGRSPR